MGASLAQGGHAGLARALVATILTASGSLLGLWAQPAGAPVVDVTGGKIRGALILDGGAVFKGVPYAQPPIGDLRWYEPKPVIPWNGVRDATSFGAICPQNPSGTVPNAADLFSEDCLFVNVWTSQWPVRRPQPTFVWIHGGANINGGASEARYDGARLARRGVVVVTFNYRLGSFGFFSHPALTRESPRRTSGNQGLLDQIAAVSWVRANIATFGGDPDNITLAGSSAGAIDIGALMTSPLAKGLFKQAIGQSGAVTNGLPTPLPLLQAEQEGERLAATWTGSPSLSLNDLRAVPVSDILKRQALAAVPQLNVSVDGYVLPRSPAAVFATGLQQRVPLLLGSNAIDFLANGPPAQLDAAIAEAYGPLAPRAQALYGSRDDVLYGTSAAQWLTDTTFRCPTIAQLIEHVGAGNPAFAYEFARLRSPLRVGSPSRHGVEVLYLFGTLSEGLRGTRIPAVDFNETDTKIASLMQKYWANFARTGNPNGDGVAVWPPFDAAGRNYLQFTDAGAVGKQGLRQSYCDLYIENTRRLVALQRLAR